MPKTKKQKWTIHWLEYHVIDDLGLEPDSKEEKKWIKEKLSYLPKGSNCQGDVYGDGTFEFECYDTFNADTIEEAKKICVEDYDEVEIFCCYNKKGDKFDEGDCEEEHEALYNRLCEEQTEPDDEYDEDNLQENSHKCIKCGIFYSEESGAVEGFVCENCEDDEVDHAND